MNDSALQEKTAYLENELKKVYPTIDFKDDRTCFMRRDGLFFWLDIFYEFKVICPQYADNETLAKAGVAADGRWYDYDMPNEEMLKELLLEIEDINKIDQEY